MQPRRRSVLTLGAAAAAVTGMGSVVMARSQGTRSPGRGGEALEPWQNPTARLKLLAMDRWPAGPQSPVPAARELIAALAQLDVRTGLALGSTLFASDVFRPRQLTDMPAFAGDILDKATTHGDVLVELGGRDGKILDLAIRTFVASVPSWQLKWQIDGLRTEHERGLSRNAFHFTEGFGNPESPHEAADRALIRRNQGEPEWAVGGSYQVVRIVRLATELWDKDSVNEQEQIIGRRRDGRWLDGTPVSEEPNFRTDPTGRLTPLDSHVRLASPDRRNPPPLLRRSYNYDRGNGDSGLIFTCFQRDLVQGFEAVQKRLEGEAMAPYLLTTGGGYFFVPPPGDAWIERALDS